jgi:small ubiquitin-related modifier
VVDREAHEVFFKIKTTTKLGKLMDVYANRVGHEPNTIRFIFDGVK